MHRADETEGMVMTENEGGNTQYGGRSIVPTAANNRT